MEEKVKRLTTGVLVVASLYSLYLVIHPYTPLSTLSISILDLVQVQRATHVMFLLFAGYLVFSLREPGPRSIGGWVFAAMASLPLVSFWQLDLSLPFKAAGTVFWAVSVLPALFPGVRRRADLFAAVLALAPYIFELIYYEDIINRAMLPEPVDMVMGFGLTFLVLGMVFRTTGPVMPSLVLFFFIYDLHGDMLPGVFSHAPFSLDLLLGKLYSETEAGLFGIITGVSMKYLVYFTILGGVIASLDIGKIVANIALIAVGKAPDAPGRVTSIASVFMGMFSGSGAADTQFVSTISKPLFERAGYDKYTAAGIAATAGTIAMITPPVLGSMAFVMVEIISIPYLWVCIMSLGPLFGYLVAILAYNYLYAKKVGLAPVPMDEKIGRRYFFRYGYIFVPLFLIIAFIYFGYPINLAVTIAAASFVVFCYLDPTLRPKSPKVLLRGLADGFATLIPIGVAVVAANIIMTLMVLTGLTSSFSQFLTQMSGQNLFLAAFFAAFFSLLLGMGIPPTATYVVASSLTAPAIMKVAIANGIPPQAALLSTHMFLMYYAVLADVTPPVALSAYAAASVFETHPLRTGIYAAKVALPKYLVGFSFILAAQGTALLIMPALQTSPWTEAMTQFLIRLAVVLAGVICMSAATVGYARRPLAKWESWVLGILSLGLFFPHTWFNLAVLVPALWFFRSGASKSIATKPENSRSEAVES